LQQSSIDQGLNYGGDRDTHGVVNGIDNYFVFVGI
jgi:hypothetical protein